MHSDARLADYVKLYSDTLTTRLFSEAGKRDPLETLRRALNGADPNNPAAFMTRLSAATQPGMPAPDETMVGTPTGTKILPRPPGAMPLQSL